MRRLLHVAFNVLGDSLAGGRPLSRLGSFAVQ
jgi:hypothetical protein